MAEITEQLINKLESIHNETHLPLERRLIDTAVWYHKNKDRIPKESVLNRLEFLSKAFDIQLELTCMLVERMQLTEGRSKGESLWLPNGATYTDDMGRKQRFG